MIVDVKKPSKIHSCYLDDVENDAVRITATENGVSPNAIIRWAVRALLELPHPAVTIPDSVRELSRR